VQTAFVSLFYSFINMKPWNASNSSVVVGRPRPLGHLTNFFNTPLGDRSFAAARPRVWNSLPTQLRESDIHSDNFDEHLKHIYLVTDSCGAEW